MPTNTNAYNSRVTDEALEKRFRDTFRAQGGSELVDDLYAQGVIVPVVDFTAAATGQQLATDLQTAWDFSTGSNQVSNATTTVISNAGFWRVQIIATFGDLTKAVQNLGRIDIFDGSTTTTIWGVSSATSGTSSVPAQVVTNDNFVVFLRSGDVLRVVSSSTEVTLDVVYRQIATVSGDLVNPTGFTSS